MAELVCRNRIGVEKAGTGEVELLRDSSLDSNRTPHLLLREAGVRIHSTHNAQGEQESHKVSDVVKPPAFIYIS